MEWTEALNARLEFSPFGLQILCVCVCVSESEEGGERERGFPSTNAKATRANTGQAEVDVGLSSERQGLKHVSHHQLHFQDTHCQEAGSKAEWQPGNQTKHCIRERAGGPLEW